LRSSTLARITGVVYCLYFIAALTSAALAPGVTGPGTLDRASAEGPIYQLGVALGLLSTVLYLTVVGLLYRLFAATNRTVARLAVLFGLTGCTLMAIGTALQLAAPTSTPELADGFLKLNATSEHVALVFFGGFQVFLGCVIYQSRQLPRIIGVLIALAGVGWLTFLTPQVPRTLLVLVAAFGGLSELSLMLWLLVVGMSEREGWTSSIRSPALSSRESD
jgi:uncharacterized protein DUF4386